MQLPAMRAPDDATEPDNPSETEGAAAGPRA